MTIAIYNVTTATGNAYISGGNTAITSLTLCNYGAGNVTANLYVEVASKGGVFTPPHT